jgi:hypothetical protein
MLHVHLHAPDLAQSRNTRLALPAHVGVAVGVRLRSSDKSSWRLEPFLEFLCLSLSLIAACAQSWERLFHFLLVHLILGLVSLSFPFCCIYPALKRSIPSSWFAVAVCCHLIFGLSPSVPLIQCLYSSKSLRCSCGMHGPLSIMFARIHCPQPGRPSWR